MATYSQSIIGVGAGNPFEPKFVKIDDATCVTAGDEQNAMTLGTVFTAQGPDGGSYLAVFDTERCIPGVRRVIRRYQ